MTDEELLNVVNQAQQDVSVSVAEYKQKWKDISLVDLLPLWAERNKQVESNKDVLRDSRKDLKAALKDFNATVESKAEHSVALVQLFKASFDRVVSTSKFAEQSFQSAYLILQNVNDPLILVERAALLVSHTREISTRMRVVQEVIEQLRSQKSSGELSSELESCREELRAMQETVLQQRAQSETSERTKVDLVRRFEADMARKDQELDTLLETVRRQRSEQHPMDSSELKQALEAQKQSEAERKLATVRCELASLEEKHASHISRIESEAAQDKARCSSLQDSLRQSNQNVKTLEHELRDVKDQHAALQASSRVDWPAMTERIVGFYPESVDAQTSKMQDRESAEKILAAQFRKIENELVACRVKFSELQESAALQISNTRNVAVSASSSGNSWPADVSSNFASSSSSRDNKDVLMAVTKQRNALQEEVTRLNVLYTMQRNNNSEGGGGHRRKNPYDVENQDNGSHGANGIGELDLDDKSSKAFQQMNFAEQTLVRGYKMGLHDYWSRHALLIYLALIHIFALFYAVHDLNPEIVSEVDRVQPMEW